MKSFEQKVTECTNWSQLLRVALTADAANEPGQKGIYYSGWRFCSAQRLNLNLKAVRDGEAPLNSITRNYGLRDKVLSLQNTEKRAI